MATPPQPPQPGRFNWTALSAVAALVVALATMLTASFGAWSTSVSVHEQRLQAQAQLKTTAIQAQVQAANQTATPACNPAMGSGKLGVCSPPPITGALAKAAGDPLFISGIKGVDVSSFQNCSHAFAGVAFVITKATESTGYTDHCLGGNIAAAKQQGKVYGTYDFLRPGRTSADAEAQHYIGAVNAAGAQKGLLIADVEANAGLSPTGVHSYVCTWVRDIRNTFHPRTVVVYTGNWFWSPSVAGDNCGTKLWISAYAATAYVPRAWGGGQFPYGRYSSSTPFWQYSDGVFGPSPHINGWDSDYFNGSLSQLRALVAPPVPPIPAKWTAACSKLDGIEWFKHHRGRGHVSRNQHHQAVVIRRNLRRANIGCTAQPHSKPYRGHHRKGALA